MALISACAAIVIALVALKKFVHVTDSAIWAIAVMILSPAILGIGVSYFVHRTATANRGTTGPN